MRAAKVFLNGVVLTMDRRDSVCSAFGIAGDRFCVVGSDREVTGWAGPETKVTDLQGKTVVPGFIESHSHLSLYAMTRLQADCRTPPNQNLADVLERIRTMAETVGPGEWVRGWGYDDTLIAEKRHLTRSDLDSAALRHPLFVSHASGHLAYANSRALSIAGIGPDTPQPEGGTIHKDAAGIPTGLLMEEAAQRLVLRHIPLFDSARLKTAMLEAMGHFHQFGITGIHDAAVGYFRHHRPILTAYRELEKEGKLRIRVYLTIVEDVYRGLLETGLGTGFGSEILKLGAVKLFQDGSIQALTAALAEPYHNAPGFRGDLIVRQDVLDDLVERYHCRDIQIAVHANGERAIESVLQAMEKARLAHPGARDRHMIIHCQLASGDQIRRMKELGVIPSYFVNHVYYWGDRHLGIFLGPERARRIDPLQSTVREGLMFTLHSDLPVTPVDPIFSIHNAVNRTTRDGELLGPEERISALEALKAYTIYAAHCSYEEHLKGSIEAGKLADFTVLSANPLSVRPEDIKDIRVVRTVVGGTAVYGAGSAPEDS